LCCRLGFICATRYRYHTCAEPTYQQQKFDDEVALETALYLSKPKFVEAELKESRKEGHRAAVQAKIAAKERTILEIEKKCSRVMKAVEDTDHPGLNTAQTVEPRSDLRTENDPIVALRYE
jgi:hypothetical protein